MGWIITQGFVPELENPYKELYRKDYIRNAIKNLIEEKGVKCRLEKRVNSAGEYDAEIIAVKCVDYTTFSNVSIPIVTTQELREMCDCETIRYLKEYLNYKDPALVDTVFEWIRCQKCKAEKLWEILSSLGLNKIINFDQVADLFIPDPSLLK